MTVQLSSARANWPLLCCIRRSDGYPTISFRLLSALLILLGLISFAGGGCASQHDPPLAWHYKKILERQKAGLPLAEDPLKTLPEMTVADYETLGDDYLRQSNLNMAFVQYDRALQLDATHVRLRYKTGLLFLKKGLPEEAIKAFQHILKNDMTYALAYEGLGQALLQMRDDVEAEKSFRQALQVNPELWQSHNFLGIIYDRQKRFGKDIPLRSWRYDGRNICRYNLQRHKYRRRRFADGR